VLKPAVLLTTAALASIVIFSTVIIVVNTEGHGVSGMGGKCSPLTIIKDCGIPTPTVRDFDAALIYLITIPLLQVSSMFIFRNYYLQRKDFYVVR
jgi:hypothetical protein